MSDYGKMEPVIKAKWLEALRSGKYRQGPGCLRRKVGEVERFCCLGVLYDVEGSHSWVPLCDGSFTIDNSMDASLSMPFRNKVGVGDWVIGNLIAMNDGDAGPVRYFPEIADWIEVNL